MNQKQIMTYLLCLVIVGISQDTVAQNDGKSYLASGDYQKAKTHYLNLVRSSPNDGEINHYLGRSYFRLNESDKALDHLIKAADLNPNNSEYQYWVGEAYLYKLEEGNMFEKVRYAGKVKERYAKAVELDPKNTLAREALATYYYQAPGIAGGSISEAKKHANIIIGQEPARGYGLMASIYVYDDELDLAEQELMKWMKVEPAKEKVYYQMGRMYQDAEKYDKAFTAFEKSIHTNGNYGPSYYQYARTGVFAEMNTGKAIGYMQKYLTMEPLPDEPDWSSAQWRLGMLYEIEGNQGKARQAYNTALELDPNNESAQKALKQLD